MNLEPEKVPRQKSVTINETTQEIEPDVISTIHDTVSEISIRFSEVKFQCAYCSKAVVAHCCDCEDYLCLSCCKRHGTFQSHKSHDVCFFYCGEKLKSGKKVRASGFCRNCVEYLCDKCVLMHSGFRKFRNHVIVTGVDMPFVNTMNIMKKGITNQRTSEENKRPRNKTASRFTGRTYSGRPYRYLDFLNTCKK